MLVFGVSKIHSVQLDKVSKNVLGINFVEIKKRTLDNVFIKSCYIYINM